MDEIKPCACVGKTGLEHLDPYDPPPLFPADEYCARTDVYLYDQQAIDTLMAEIARRTEQVKQVTSSALGLMGELGELRSDYSRCRVAADKWSERELLFGAHEDLQVRAERAEAEAEGLRYSNGTNATCAATFKAEAEALEKRVDELQLALMVAASDLQSYGHHAAAHRAACAAHAAKQAAD